MNARLQEMKARLKNVQTEEERQLFNEYCNNVYAGIAGVRYLDGMSNDEIYNYIRSLRDIARKYEIMHDEKVMLAETIIDGWVTLDEAASKDQNLSDDWEAFLITMKLMEK